MNFLPAEIDGDTIKLPIGAVKIPDDVRHRLESGNGGGRGGIVAGLRPEHSEDANLVHDPSRGHTFRAKIDVLESMGSEFYAYFVVESEKVSASELEELAQDAGAADLPHSHEGSQVVARLDAASRVRQGQEAELWFDSQHLQLFDLESARSLLVSGTGNGRRDGSGPPQTQTSPAQAQTSTA
jgi:multiple sugar transport system ATP-binding protein